MRLAATRRRVMASVLLPSLTPNGLSVSAGLANGSKPALVQSSSIALNVSRISRRLEVLDVVELGLAVGVVVTAGEHVDGAVVVDGAEHAVEVDGAVEEVPRDVALQRAQERVDAEHVLAGGPGDVDEVLVAGEVERAEGELAVALRVRGRSIGRRSWSCQWFPLSSLSSDRSRPSARRCRRRGWSAAG